MSAERTPFVGSRRDLQVDVAADRADDVVRTLRDLVGQLPEHPAIVPLIDVGVAGGRLFLVFAPTPGEPLDAALRAYGPADIADALPRLRRIADALDAASAHSLHHGALTPEHIVISVDDTRVEGIGVAETLLRQRLTVTHAPPYAAPEVSASSAASARADQFALAAIAHEWLFGRAIAGPSEDRLEVPALPGVDRDTLTRAFVKALASDPADRFETSTAFVEAMGAAVGAAPSKPVDVPRFWSAASIDELPIYSPESARETASVGMDRDVEEERRPRIGAIAAVIVGGIAIGALAMWLTSRSARHQSQARLEPGQPFTDAPVGPSFAPGGATEGRPVAPVARVAPVAPDAVAASRGDAGLLVHSTPAGAVVTIDGVDRGVTPVAIRGLSLGVRNVVVTRPGYRPSERRVALTSDRPSRTLEVGLVPAVVTAPSRAAAAESGLVVDSKPSGAAVSIDGRPVGVTPLTLPLAPGRYTVRLERLGYRAVTSAVDVGPGQRARVAARLEGGQEEE